MLIIAAFSTLICVGAVAAVLLSKTDEPPAIPHDAIAGLVMETLHNHAVAPLSGKRMSLFFYNPNLGGEICTIGSKLCGA